MIRVYVRTLASKARLNIDDRWYIHVKRTAIYIVEAGMGGSMAHGVGELGHKRNVALGMAKHRPHFQDAAIRHLHLERDRSRNA